MKLNKLKDLFKKLVRKRVYCSESDLQFALAWELRKKCTDVCMELPLEMDEGKNKEDKKKRKKREYLDILLVSGSKNQAIEIKYKQNEFECKDEHTGRSVKLKYHSAPNLGLYDFWWDVHRVERFCKDKKNKIKSGFVIFFTNDEVYTKGKARKKIAACDDFRLNNGITTPGLLKMGYSVKKKSLGGRIRCFRIDGRYKIKWEDEDVKVSVGGKVEKVKFYFVILEVPPQPIRRNSKQ